MHEIHELQISLPLQAGALSQPDHTKALVLDLFTGLGGLAVGFRDAGFAVTGVDREPVSAEVYSINGLGDLVAADLASEMIIRDVPAVVGGPPCRPWSAVNTKRRRAAHEDHRLLERFFLHVVEIRPEIFLMENVLALKSDATYMSWSRTLQLEGYAVATHVLQYSDFGSPTTRKRLFTVGVRHSIHGARSFFLRLKDHHTAPRTVRQAIFWARDLDRGDHPDHDWSNLRTIHKYSDRYAKGKYGWMRLSYDRPAPSFGSVAKTYILHPEAGQDSYPLRVISVREAMSIMGFAEQYRFPQGVARAKRYQMVANAVSPVVAHACAHVIRSMLEAGSGLAPVDPRGDDPSVLKE